MLNRPSAFLQRERVCVKIRNILLNDTERTFSNGFSIQFLPAENVWNVKNFPLPLASLCLNPNGPLDMFWLLLLTVHTGVLWEGENFSLCAGT